MAANSIRMSAHSSPAVRARSTAANWPRIRLMRNKSFCFSFEISGILSCIFPAFSAFLLYNTIGGYDTKRSEAKSVATPGATRRMVAEIRGKEGNDDELHDSILTANDDGDDAAQERNPPRRFHFVAGRTEGGTQVFAHE